MIGHTISHYRILEKLGEGGMGVVYKALDTSLERIVAIKFLSSQALPTTHDKSRFEREARAAASLNHPNVTTVFEYGEAEDPDSGRKISFIAMEFVEGVLLSAKIKNGPIPTQEALDTAIAVGEAIAKAHDNGIVHRDLKPDNIMVSNHGVVKVMDFGLADIAGVSRVTKEGSTVGTVSYMSPEQAQGDAVDARSDLWSLGVVLYEMLTGKRPFEASFDQALIYQILNTEPETPRSVRPNIPDVLDRIVQRLLQKRVQDRYQHVSEVLADLRAVGSTTTQAHGPSRASAQPPRSPLWKWVSVAGVFVAIIVIGAFIWNSLLAPAQSAITSLAVLPFENISPDPDQEYFADGMTDQLISELSRIHSVRVISRTSAMQFKGRRQSIADIARTLNVEGIVTATVLRSGERLRVNAQLVRARDETNLWGDSYDREIADVLDLTSALARSIADEIQAALTPEEVQTLSESRPVNPEAFDLVARGYFLLTSSADRQNLEKGLELMQKAARVDPSYADAYVGIVTAFLSLHSFGYVTGPEIYEKARIALDTAMALDPSNGRAHTFLGQLLWIGGDIEGCMAAHVEAVKLSPNDGLVRTIYSWILMAEGRFAEGIKEAEIAVSLDPLSHFARCNLMGWYYADHQYEKARAEAQSILEMAPHWVPAQDMLMWVAYREGRYADAVREGRKMWLMSGSLIVPEGLSWPEYVEWVISRLEARPTGPTLGALATYYGVKGDNDNALAVLEQAAKEVHPITLLLFYPEFDSLRSDPRFAEFVERIRLPVTAYCDIEAGSRSPETIPQE